MSGVGPHEGTCVVARGKRTPRDVEALFREHYLRTGSAREAGRLAKLKRGTEEELAKRANADPKFRQAQDDLIAGGYRRAHLAVIGLVEFGTAALAAGPLEDSFGAPIDRRAELMRAVTSAFDSLDRVKARVEAREEKRREAESGDTERPTRIEIVRYTTESKPPERPEAPQPEPPPEAA